MKRKLFTIALVCLAIGFLESCQKDNTLQNELPAGALPGKFSVSADKQVYFSQGNLWYDGSAFKFETNQYDVQNTWSTSHVSHFCWSRTASVTYAETYNESGTSTNDVLFTNAEAETAKSDFTVNGVTGKYRTLSTAEWQYLFNTRAMTNGGSRYENLTSSGITIQGVTFKGMVLFPDDFTEQATWKDTYTTWEALNSAGLVLLPAAGYRNGSDVHNVGDYGYYWSSSADDSYRAYLVYFDSDYVYPDSYDYRNYGFSVRLITECR